MIVPDVNVLVAALRRDHPHHAPVRAVLPQLLAREPPLVPLVVVGALVRITTKARVFDPPESTESAFAFTDALLDVAGARIAQDDPATARRWQALCLRHRLAGDAVADAHLAAVALEQGASLVSLDRGFARFSGLRLVNPLDP